ncbi:ATP-dependent Clp protease, ATP-binding subunit ClpA [mine drainage metagenome]|uniref:ATP-dependent Clp protease, ATP-binding subunit ClpA n=1 Tax=mine drainage metagenome TaxID=410659 RepID=T1BD98_9ZZZZ
MVKHPHSVLLLDEIEKAHPDVFNILLQVMDRGALTDTNGREANFKNVIVVMTTNAGASLAARRSIGFVEQNHASDAMEVIRRTFTPSSATASMPSCSLARWVRSRAARGRQIPDRARSTTQREARQPQRRAGRKALAGRAWF